MIKYDIYDDKKYGKIIITREPIHFQIGSKCFVVEKGYQSEGFSVPRFMWWIITPTSDRRTIMPAIKHDWLFDNHVVSRKIADRYLRDDLIRNGFPLILSYISWLAVRCFGWLYW